MAVRTLPGLGLTAGWALRQSGWGDPMNVNLRLLSAMTQLSVISQTTALPGSPSNGDIYIVPAGAGSNANEIAVRDEGAWVYIVPVEGVEAWVRDTNLKMIFDGTVWRSILSVDPATGLIRHPTNTDNPTPTITCGTPGDLSVAYTTQVLDLYHLNGLVCFALRMQFIPTFTTASGQIRIVGFPFTFVGGAGVLSFGNSATIPTYPAGISYTVLHCAAGQNFAVIRTQGSGVGGSLQMPDLVSGSSYIIDASGFASV